MATAPLLLAVAVAMQAPAGPFTSEAGGFRVALPGVPKEVVKKVVAGGTPLDLHLFTVQHGGTESSAIYSDLPETMALADPDRVLEGGIDGAVKSIRGKILLKRNIAIAGHPGKEFSARFAVPSGADGLYRERLYLVGVRLYQVSLAGPEGEVAGEAGDRILESFALLKPPPPPRPIKPLAAGKAFRSEEGRFRVRFPEAPREQVQKVESPAGPIEIRIAVVDRGDVAYFVTYNDYAFDPALFGADDALESSVRGSIESSKATLRAKRDIHLDDHPGKAYEATLALPDGRAALCRARVYLVEKRLYQVLVIEAKGKEDPKAATTFLDSFALLKPPTP